MAKNALKLANQTNVQMQETEQTPNRINERKYTAKQIIINLLQTKDKENIWKAAREKHALSKEEHQFE